MGKVVGVKNLLGLFLPQRNYLILIHESKDRSSRCYHKMIK